MTIKTKEPRQTILGTTLRWRKNYVYFQLEEKCVFWENETVANSEK